MAVTTSNYELRTSLRTYVRIKILPLVYFCVHFHRPKFFSLELVKKRGPLLWQIISYVESVSFQNNFKEKSFKFFLYYFDWR